MILFSSVYNFYFNGLMEPTCLKIIYIRVCVCNTCGFHNLLYCVYFLKQNREVFCSERQIMVRKEEMIRAYEY
jgi:hypothetical protein